METTYYGSVTVTFKPICFHCGETSGSKLLNHDFTRDLKRKYAKVGPIWRMGRAAGRALHLGCKQINKEQKV